MVLVWSYFEHAFPMKGHAFNCQNFLAIGVVSVGACPKTSTSDRAVVACAIMKSTF